MVGPAGPRRRLVPSTKQESARKAATFLARDTDSCSSIASCMRTSPLSHDQASQAPAFADDRRDTRIPVNPEPRGAKTSAQPRRAALVETLAGRSIRARWASTPSFLAAEQA
jgi:hypothetical protein